MKNIGKIDKVTPSYNEMLLGDQVRIIDTPFGIRTGILNVDGKVQNAIPREREYLVEGFTLIANTAGQSVLTFPNRGWKSLLLTTKSSTSDISYDYSLYMKLRGETQRRVFDAVGAPVAFKDGIASSAPQYFHILRVPYGKDVALVILMDNNHATNNMSMMVSALLLDPVA